MLNWTHRIVWGLSGVFALAACSNDPELTQPAQQGGRGESCQARNDCVAGLACVKNVCSQNDFPIAVTAKQCDLIQCSSKDDCCKTFTPSSSCDSYQQQCTATGDQFSCNYVQQYCACRQDCQENRCVSVNPCSTDIDCFSGVCANGACVDCRADTDCGSSFKCVSGACKAGCTKNEECPLLQTCDGGQCVESGCLSDRECIGFSGSPLAKCVNKKCVVPCENDAECGRFEVCEGGNCLFIGCETDNECRYLTETPLTPNTNLTAVCR